MDKLPQIIGLAPSELSLGDFKVKLSKERDRVRRCLEYFKNVTLRQRGRKKAKPTTKLKALVAETGLTPKQIVKAIELMKAEAKEALPQDKPITPLKVEDKE
jgi:hypothetical protein